MSKKAVKTVRITESELVGLIEKIASEAVVQEKEKWIAEQAEKGGNLLESKLATLEKKVSELVKAKK